MYSVCVKRSAPKIYSFTVNMRVVLSVILDNRLEKGTMRGVLKCVFAYNRLVD